MNLDKRLEVIQTGKMAEIALHAFESEIKTKQSDLLKTVIGAYRLGNIQHDAVVGFISSYVALEDLLGGMRRKITALNNLDKEVKDDGSSSTRT